MVAIPYTSGEAFQVVPEVHQIMMLKKLCVAIPYTSGEAFQAKIVQAALEADRLVAIPYTSGEAFQVDGLSEKDS